MKSSERVARLGEARRHAEGRLQTLRAAIDREVGWSPNRSWLLPLVGLACGAALAAAVRSLGGKRRELAEGDGG